MQNRDVAAAIDSLSALGKATIPMMLAVRVAKARRALEDHQRAVDEVRQQKFMEITGGSKNMTQGSLEHAAFTDAVDELGKAECPVPDRFVLYSRTQGEEVEYSWVPTFKTKIVAIEPNTLFGLIPHMLEVSGAATEGESA